LRDETTVEVTLNFSNGGRLSPEDLALIAAIRKERSILGASRATGVSYRKCWLMVDALNRTFETPVFATFPGRRGGGAELTSFGERLVALYESMNRRARTGAKAAIEELSGALDPKFQPRASGAAAAHSSPEQNPRRSRPI
jgi:molybdate transport system regulatory protein